MPKEETHSTRGIPLDLSRYGKSATGRSWFFGIGINTYASFPNLHNARKDILNVLQLLEDRYELHEHMTLLDEKATRDAILEQFATLHRQLKEDDKLIIYYSGHGYLNKRGRGFWLPTDAIPNKESSYVRSSTIKEEVADLNCRHILVISDSCFSGALLQRNASYEATPLEDMENRRSRWVFSSGRQQEAVADGRPGENSPFTASILKVLGNNQSPLLNFTSLFNEVIKLIQYNYSQVPQFGILEKAGHEVGGEYIFRLLANEAADWKACLESGFLADFKNFLHKYPNGQYAKTAKARILELEREEAAAWNAARSANTLLSYHTYIKRYPFGIYRHEAFQSIKQLEEREAWEKALEANTLSAYIEFKRRYSRGIYYREAELSIQAILSKKQEYETWKEAKRKGSAEAFQAYLRKYPQGKYAEEARATLKSLYSKPAKTKYRKEAVQSPTELEKKAWREAQASNSESGYRQYLQQYPTGQFAEEARAVLEKMRKARGKNKVVVTPPRPKKKKVVETTSSSHRKRAKAGQLSLKIGFDRRSWIPRWLLLGLGGLALIVLLAWGGNMIFNGYDEYPQLFEESGKYGYRDENSQTRIDAWFDEARPFKNGKARVSWNGFTYFIDENGHCVSDCPDDIDDKLAWEKAEAAGKREAYVEYLLNFSNGKHSTEAIKMIDQLNPITVFSEIDPRNKLTVSISKEGQVLVRDKILKTSHLRNHAKTFIDNPQLHGDLAQSPRKAYIFLKKADGTKDNLYNQVYLELCAAYAEIWEEESQKKFGQHFNLHLPMPYKKVIWVEVPFLLAKD